MSCLCKERMKSKCPLCQIFETVDYDNMILHLKHTHGIDPVKVIFKIHEAIKNVDESETDYKCHEVSDILESLLE